MISIRKVGNENEGNRLGLQLKLLSSTNERDTQGNERKFQELQIRQGKSETMVEKTKFKSQPNYETWSGYKRNEKQVTIPKSRGEGLF